ncbi:hypothetical protein BXZ70DRAFT_450241 [Cristinia sonorae]|uniref:PH domain-containing protein n=1 Tax=Cristinia sonorae TaxID=1940300 RepID=A0A8K0UJ27_9AGAR|nr:hypothetical protein BXZ70DRAFT_450241 [Cristinia sonorae]
MASISSNSWDARSESFASPAQLQHWQHPNEFGQSPPTRPSPLSSFPPLSPQQQQPPDMRRTVSGQPAAPPPQSHTRTISSFSLFGRKSQPMEATSPPPTSHKQSASVPEFPKPPNVLSRRPSNTPSPSNTNGNTPPPPQPQPQRQPSANPSTGTPANPTPQLHPEIRSIVQLTAAHTRKVYFSGPMVRKVEYQPDGQKPSKDEGWRNVWCQLGGTTLSLWDMKEIEEASKQGRQVPPSYINVTDAFVVVVGNLTTPAPGAPDSTRAYGPVAPGPTETYPNVFSVNTAGLNLLLFSCPSTQALISWVSALRLAAWEKSRLEEMYTAHLIRVMLNDGRETRTPLVRGKMEGWVRIRIAGQTDWKLLWMVISAGVTVQESGSPAPSDNRPTSPSAPRKNRLSQLFSRDHVPTQSTQAGVPSKAQIQVFASPKPKDKKKALLTMQDITQAFAVYPERPELISRSTLIKLEGKFGDEEMAASMRDKEAWLLAMPELEANNTRASEMLKWLIAVHDAFGLYGRPQIYSWDPRDPDSTMFAYPIGPTRDLLFLDRELAETLDPREVQTSAIRRQLRSILWQRMNGSNGSPSEKAQPPIPLEGQPPKIPPLSDIQSRSEQPVASGSRLPSQSPSGAPQISMQIPSLDFDHPSERVPESLPEPPTQSQARSLTPITEASNQPESRSRSSDTAPGLGRSAGHSPAASQPSNSPPLSEESRREQDGASGARVITSPSPSTADSRPFGYRPSEEPHFVVASRPASKQGQYSSPRIPTVAPGSDVDHAANVQLPMSPRNEQPFSPTTAPQPTSPSPKPASVSPPASSQYSQKSLSPPPPVHTPRAPSPPSSVLTSPHSPVSKRFSISTLPYPGSVRSQPFAIQQSVSSDTPSSPAVSYADPVPPPSPAHSSLSSSMQPPAQRREVRREPSEENVLGKEAGALYYMRHIEGDAPPITGPRRLPPPTTDDEEEDEEGSTDSPSLYTPPATSSVNPLNIRKSPSPPPFPPSKASSINVYPGARRGSVDTQGAVTSPTSSILGGARTQDAPSRFGSVAKPGGARARAGSKIASAGTPDQAANTRRGEQQTFQQQPPPSTSFSSSSNSDYGDKKTQEKHDTMPIQQDHSELSYAYDNEPQHGYDDAADAMAALKLLEQDEVPAPQRKTTLPTSPRPAPPAASPSPKPSENSLQSTQQRSSFAPSKSAAERKAKSQAQQAAHHAAVHKPGRANGNKKGRAREAGAWGESSDEEEEEEEDEEDDDEADSDEDLPPRHRAQQQQAMGSPNSAGRAGYSTAPSMQSMPPQQGMSQDMGGYGRRGRELPQVPSHLQGLHGSTIRSPYVVPQRASETSSIASLTDDASPGREHAASPPTTA